MKSLFFILAVMLFTTACNQHIIPSNTPIVNKSIVNESGDTILAGHCAIDIMYKNPYKIWYDSNYENYKVDSNKAIMLQPLLSNKTIEIFMGSWCGDTRREVPRMLKILQVAQMDTNKIKLIFVDNSTATYKQSTENEEHNKNIHHVPTFIVYDTKEIGRIIETPLESFEKDLLTILLKTAYTPKYKAIEYWIKNVSNKNKIFNENTLQKNAILLKALCKHSGELNAYGYVLLAQKKYNQAINVLKLNVAIYPNNAGVYDSLGEAYLTIGDKQNAKINYDKVLQIIPDDTNAKKMLDKILSM